MATFKSLLLLVAVAPLVTLAQTQNTQQTCNDSMSMTFDPQKFAGIWFEVARNPAPPRTTICTQVNITLDGSSNNEVYDIATTYGDAPNFAWVNNTITASVTVDNGADPYGYNFSYALGSQTLPLTTYKLLDTDYDNYALVCGYQNLTNNASFFNILLTRDRMPTGVQLNQIEGNASLKFAGFDNSSMTVIAQTIYCYTYGAASSVMPFVYGLALTLLLSINNFF